MSIANRFTAGESTTTKPISGAEAHTHLTRFTNSILMGTSRVPIRRFVIDGATGASIALVMLVAPVAAQATPTPAGTGSGGSSFLQVACSAGLGQLFTFILTGAAVFVIAKGMITAVIGWDQTKSGSGSKQKQGRQSMRDGATQVVGGIFTPPMLIGALHAMGVSLGCLTPTVGIL